MATLTRIAIGDKQIKRISIGGVLRDLLASTAYSLTYNSGSVTWNGGEFDANNITAAGTLIPAGSATAGFTPASLFANAEAGAWYDFDDLSTLWQDEAGTVAVTTSGDVVARIDDKSGNGNNITQPTVAARPVYTSDANGSRLVFDGVDDFMPINGAMLAGTNYSIHVAWRLVADPGTSEKWVIGGTGTSNNTNLHVGWKGNTTLTFDQWNNGVSSADTWSANPSILSGILRTDGRFIRTGGAQKATSATLTQLTGWNGAAVGRRGPSYFKCEVYSLVLRAANTTDAQAYDVEKYQANIAGVTV